MKDISKKEFIEDLMMEKKSHMTPKFQVKFERMNNKN